MATKRVHLLCNAHLDPVWQWEWQEGAAEALSTFRTAADLCEEFDGFIFNHNEAILYQWVGQYAPALFKRIQKLVRQGKWHIMGGWFLQPDVNMPSGESLVRQILVGRNYFRDKFGVTPTTAINFDPFGHSHGLVQILRKSGYDAYLFGRPIDRYMDLPYHDFVWVGCDGSEILASRFIGWYNHPLGKIQSKLEKWLDTHPDPKAGLLLWGVGDHGGGPSRQDLRTIEKLRCQNKDYELVHSTPEAYFKQIRPREAELPRVDAGLHPSCVGCYTTQVLIKQKHRTLENELYATEKMLATAVGQGLMRYPTAKMVEATRDLLFAEFHDILPGSSIQKVEQDALRLMDHALEELSRIKTETFFALSAGQQRGKDGGITLLVYNPHPYPVRTIVEGEYQLPDNSREEQYTIAHVSRGGKRIASQMEKEASNVNMDWRSKVVFEAELPPSQMSRFDCALEIIEAKPAPELKPVGGKIRFKTRQLDVVINTRTGLVDRYRIDGVDQIRPGAFEPLVMEDRPDSWCMYDCRFRTLAGRFKPLSQSEAGRFAGIPHVSLPAVRVIEDGPIRTIVEALFGYGDSHLCQRYKLPRRGTEIEVETRVYWNEKDRCLKLQVPLPAGRYDYLGQTVFGIEQLPTNGNEAVAQKWTAAVNRTKKRALTCINEGTYGSDLSKDGLRLTLLRSPAYVGHPIGDLPIVENDRFTERIDQGERLFRFWFNGGTATSRLATIDREALARNEKPYLIPFNPSGMGKKPKPGPQLSDKVVQLAAIKPACKGSDWIVRLHEPTGRPRSTTLSIPYAGIRRKIDLQGFEIKTLKINTKSKKVVETDLMEKPLRSTRK